MSLVCLNGSMVPAAEARVSLFDRGLLYGDGLFETIRVQSGRLFRWPQHLSRLEAGCRLLGLRLPYDNTTLHRQAAELIAANRQLDAVLRLTVTRGEGVRGYSPAGADAPVVALSLHPRPTRLPAPAARLASTPWRILSSDPLNQVKTNAKLPFVLARAHAEAAGADDALICNELGAMTETAGWNLFWVQDDTLHTPPISAGALPGIARAAVLELAPQLGLAIRESCAPPSELGAAHAVFTTNVVSGLREIMTLDGAPLPRDARLASWQQAFETLVDGE